jgi:hypothetical protein
LECADTSALETGRHVAQFQSGDMSPALQSESARRLDLVSGGAGGLQKNFRVDQA